MLTIRKEDFREDEINVILDRLVPENHLVRKIENAIDFSFIYDKVKDLYSPLGAPSIDPVVLIKIVLIQYLFGIPSMRQTIREIEVNVEYRWFLGYSLTEKIPHFSTFNKNYERRFKNTDLFESIFREILARATKCGFVDSSNIYIDSTHIKASANKKKYNKIKGNAYIDSPFKYYFEDVGLRNARINFRQNEPTHTMENIIYNELIIRGYSVDVGIVEVNYKDESKKSQRKQYEVDFVCNKGNAKYYIQSAYALENQDKINQETRGLNKIMDSFKKIVVVKDCYVPWYDEKGILYIGLEDFLLNPNSLDI